VILIHRHGRLAPCARLAFAAVASEEHRAALDACAWLAEALRTRAPFWRKDVGADGTARWR
ncbi:MAG: molybdenum cofactor biosynthesis protein MoaE, partial [Allosphingosinicella sp.]